MSKLKNLTVTAKTIKQKSSGLISYGNYLINKKTDSHKETNIIPIFNNFESFVTHATNEALKVDLKNAEARKGGRPVDGYAVSFNLTLPRNTIRPTPEQWKLIAQDVMRAVKKEIPGLSKQDFFINVHDQSNPHLNILVSKIIDGQRNREIDQKKILSVMKNIYSISVLKHCNFDYQNYNPLNTDLGSRKPKWQIEKNKFYDQIDALLKYIAEGNTIRTKSTENRIIKTVLQTGWEAYEEDFKKLLNGAKIGGNHDLERSLKNISDKSKTTKPKP